MARCATWRFTDVGDVSRILPVGEDHDVWGPCRARVEEPGHWCSECINAMVLCPEQEVRRALVEYEHISALTLQDLSTDSDYITSHRAQERLRTRHIWS